MSETLIEENKINSNIQFCLPGVVSLSQLFRFACQSSCVEARKQTKEYWIFFSWHENSDRKTYIFRCVKMIFEVWFWFNWSRKFRTVNGWMPMVIWISWLAKIVFGFWSYNGMGIHLYCNLCGVYQNEHPMHCFDVVTNHCLELKGGSEEYHHTLLPSSCPSL